MREFSLASESEANSADMPPLAPAQTWSRSAPGDPLVLAFDTEPVVLMAATAEHKAELSRISPEGVNVLAELPGEGKAWLMGCSNHAALQLAFGNEHALVVAQLAPSGLLTSFPPLPLELSDVRAERVAARDRVLPLCGITGGTTNLIVHDRRDRLSLVSCKPETSHCKIEQLAVSVRSFAALAGGDRVIVAYAGDGENNQVRVRSMAVAAPGNSEERVPAVCWSDARGLCGPPVLARVGERAILATREGTDLRVLESADDGITWQPLKGLNKRD